MHTTGGTIGLYSLIVHVDPLGMIQVAKNHLRLLSTQTNAPLLPHGVSPNSGCLFFGCPKTTDFSLLGFPHCKKSPHELQSELLVSPLVTPIHCPIIPYKNLLEEFKQ